MREPAPLVSRRAVLVGGLGLVLGAACGCSSGGGSRSGGAASASPGSPTAPAASGAGSPTATTSGSASASAPQGTATLPTATPWRPGPGEVQPDVKLRAVELIEALGTWGPGGQGLEAARGRVAALGLPPQLADQAGPLLPAADEAVVEVIDAQYGGILSDSASVLVVCRQWSAAGSTVTAGGTTVDVRLTAASPRWNVTALHPADPGPAAAKLPTLAARVLAQPRIVLPPAAVADLRSGMVHDSVLQAMLTLAGPYSFQVSVVRSGHPLDVFGTDRPSDHPLGRAFDTWQIDGHAVVDPATPHDLVDGFMRAAAAAGSYNVGGPRQLSGGTTSNQFFTDDTHHDHVHAGFSS
ncbi:hypothetical protein [Kitasatospora paracochleata]|uniref:Extensin-like C-terminal domain-containing protein n=1 Tax=Kitasatospora paracochleata TaxID=58354 RepID=A0ABT1J192_9ACTN|nr:hypothetical protein [Kitasatospora paracochleata]MCP2311210.1 hypothetical protein [Kitasatospora paracochleata]